MSYSFLIFISIVLGIGMGLLGCWVINFLFLFAEKPYFQLVRILMVIVVFFSSNEMLNFLDRLGRSKYPDDIFMQWTIGVVMMVALFGRALYIEKNGTARWVKYMKDKGVNK